MTVVMTTRPVDEGLINMGTPPVKSRAMKSNLTPACERKDVETDATSRPLPNDQQWAIRFSTNGLTTVVIGMRYFGNVGLSAYFAALVAARLA